MNVQLKILDERIRDYMPAYATPGSAAIDLRACIPGNFKLHTGATVKIKTGIAIHLEDPGYAAMILPRSGLGTQGLVVGNLVGLIDSDYQGELMVQLWNRNQGHEAEKYVGCEYIEINPMDRIAQLVIVPVVQAQFEVVNEFAPSVRGTGGFGSTGR
jgi:dUTP pyrophosphatase